MDNVAAILMGNNEEPTPRARHIEIQYFALQEWVNKGMISMKHIHGISNPADALTKVLGWVLHARHVKRMMGYKKIFFQHEDIPVIKKMID